MKSKHRKAGKPKHKSFEDFVRDDVLTGSLKREKSKKAQQENKS